MPDFIDEAMRGKLEGYFHELEKPVSMVLVCDEMDNGTCDGTYKLISEVASLSPLLNVVRFDLHADHERVATYGANFAPFISITKGTEEEHKELGLHFLGIPAGHEFTAFIATILMVSRGRTQLSPVATQYLEGLKDPLHLQVFSTPTCPYCPRAVSLAMQMAMTSRLVVAEAIEALEFPDLTSRYKVSGVPYTIINEGAGSILGSVPEQRLLEEIQKIIPG